jgi:hypothetical protein
MKIYNNKSDCENNVNPIGQYKMVATFNANDKCIGYRVTQEA